MAYRFIKKIFHVQNIKGFYEKYESHIGSLALILGFIFDNLTLRDASISSQTTVFVIYLVLSFVSIILLHFIQSEGEGTLNNTKKHFWFSLLLQFALGSLFSMFFVFYSRGVSIQTSWPFLLLLFANLVGNEVFKKHYVRLSVQVSLFFIALFSFSIYFVPVVLHKMGRDVFIISGILSLLLIFIFIRILSRIDRKRIKENRKRIFVGVLIVYFLLNIFYFTNVIPPVPLVMKQFGVYHSFEKQGVDYVALKEEEGSWNFLESYPKYHRNFGEAVYVATAVYAPAALGTDIIHDWQYYDINTKKWISATKIKVPIIGGRENGYRLYSMKEAVFAGLWRVDVKTSEGQIVGRIRFEIVDATATPALKGEIF